MDKLIYTAFNTLNNIYDNRSVRAQNMANINVPGYRRDLGTKSVGSAFMSSYNTFQSRALAIRDDTNVFESDPGTLSQTGSKLDIAIRGDGYFVVKGPGAPSLSRRGDLSVTNDGTLVNGAQQQLLGENLQPINVGAYRGIDITDEGVVRVEPLGSEPGTKVEVGKIALTSAFDVQLQKAIDGEIRTVDGTVPAVDGVPKIVQKHVELSNVNITEELVNTIEDQRAYEINIKLIKSASDADEAGASLMRMPS